MGTLQSGFFELVPVIPTVALYRRNASIFDVRSKNRITPLALFCTHNPHTSPKNLAVNRARVFQVKIEIIVIFLLRGCAFDATARRSGQ